MSRMLGFEIQRMSIKANTVQSRQKKRFVIHHSQDYTHCKYLYIVTILVTAFPK